MRTPSRAERFPLQIDPKSKIIVLTVLVANGRNQHVARMALDTGANVSTLPPLIASAIGCGESESTGTIEMITASGIEYAPLVAVPTLRMVGFELQNVEFAVAALPRESSIDGLIGIDILQNFDVLLAFRRGVMVFRG